MTSLIGILAAGTAVAGVIWVGVQSDHADPPAHINGTITAIHTYAAHGRAGLTGTSLDTLRQVTDPKTGAVTYVPSTYHGVVEWNPATEVCFRHPGGATDCRYARLDVRGYRVGERVIDEQVVGEFCPPHPAATDEATSRECPAFADNGDGLIDIH